MSRRVGRAVPSEQYRDPTKGGAGEQGRSSKVPLSRNAILTCSADGGANGAMTRFGGGRISSVRNYSRPVLRSAERALRVVQLLGQRGRVSLTEVARELGVSPSTAHRLLTTCCEMGFARQEDSGGTYESGAVLQELSLAFSRATALRDAGAAQLSKAAKQLRETVSVVVLEGRDVRFVETLESDRAVRVATPLGRTLPAHATAGGLAMLAALAPDELHRRFPTRGLPQVSWSAITTWDELLAELGRVRERGWAIQIGEADEEVVAVGHAILDGLGLPRASLVVSAPRARITTSEEARAVATALEPHAHKIQRRLRGSH